MNMWRLVLRLRQADIYLVLVAGGFNPPPPERSTKKRKAKRGEFL